MNASIGKVKTWVNVHAREVELVLCALAIHICFVGHGLIQEWLQKTTFDPVSDTRSRCESDPSPATTTEPFNHHLTMLFLQCWIGMLASSFFRHYLGARPDTVPLTDYLCISMSYVGSIAATSLSMEYVAYPMQILVKSMKPLPVMAMRTVLQGARYRMKEYAGVFSLSLGVAAFYLWQVETDGNAKYKHTREPAAPNYDLGFVLLVVSMLLDGYTGPKQEQVYKTHKPPMMSMMYWMNLWSALAILFVLWYREQIGPAMDFCARNPHALAAMLLFGAVTVLGQIFILWMVFRFDALTFSLVATQRKILSFLASVFFFGHPMHTMQWIGAVAVFSGTLAHSYHPDRH